MNTESFVICTRCCEPKKSVERRYSYGYYAGRLCDQCAYDAYRDHCGLEGSQGRVEELAEFDYGGYSAIEGEG